jgi:hypothetical protein
VSEVDVRERGGELNVVALAFLSTHRRAGSPWMSWVASGRHAALVKPARSGSLRMRGMGAYGRVPESA